LTNQSHQIQITNQFYLKSSFSDLIVQKKEAFELLFKRKDSNIHPSYYYQFEIRGEKKPKPKFIITKENSILLSNLNQSIKPKANNNINNNNGNNINQLSNSQNYVKNLPADFPSKQTTNTSIIDELTLDKGKHQSYSPLNNSKYIKQPTPDLNKSDIVSMNDYSMISTSNINNDLEQSMINNKINEKVKKTDNLIDQLKIKLQKFENDEIPLSEAFEMVKNELIHLRPLFISSKQTKEKVFQALSKGNQEKSNFLNKVFKSILEDSLKGVKLINSNIGLNNNKKNINVAGNNDFTTKIRPEAANLNSISKTNENKASVSPNRGLKNNQTYNEKKTKISNVINKNNININIQQYKKDKYDFELPNIKQY